MKTQAPVLLIPRVLELAECDHPIDFWSAGEKRRNEISSGTQGQSVAERSEEVKRRADVLVPQDDNPTNTLIRTRIARRVMSELSKVFNFDARAYDIGRIGCYDSSDSGFFRPHRDILSDDDKNPRKFVLSLNLNNDYTGAALHFRNMASERIPLRREQESCFRVHCCLKPSPWRRGNALGYCCSSTDVTGNLPAYFPSFP
jgi:hypothetical protein